MVVYTSYIVKRVSAMSKIPVVDGDIFASDAKIIIHQVNCKGKMNSGVAKQVREKYPIVFTHYKSWCDDESRNPKHFERSPLLGQAQIVYIEDKKVDNVLSGDRIIVNLFSQDGYGYDGKCYTNYVSMRKGLQSIAEQFSKEDEIGIPYLIGCCRGGGDWNIVSSMIEEIFDGYNVTFYKYKG